MSIFHGIQAISVYQPNSDAGTGGTSPGSANDAIVVQMDKIIADSFEFIDENVDNSEQTDPNENPYFGGEHHECRWRFVGTDGSLYSQLQTWMQDDTEVRMVAAGVSKSVLWYEDTKIQVRPIPIQGTAEGRADVYEVEMIFSGQGTHDIFGQVNILEGPLPWEDADSDGIPDGYTSSFDSNAFSDPVFSGTTGSSGSTIQIETSIEFPVSGIDIVLSHNFVTLHTDPNDQVLATNSAGGSQLSADINDATSTGRLSSSLTTPSNIYFVRMLPQRVNGASTVDTQEGKNPALRVDGKTGNVTY